MLFWPDSKQGWWRKKGADWGDLFTVPVENYRSVIQRDLRMSQDVNFILDRLIEAFPAGLSRTTPKPLKIGLGEEVMALAGVHPALADLSCVFHPNVDTDSTGNWTRIPSQTGQGFHGKLDT